MARQFIYHMQGLSKKIGSKSILNNIHLSFYPDAKIGIVGVNGSGKSTLLKIMAGVDNNFTGDSFLEKGATVGYLPQEPELDESLTVAENVTLGLSDIKDKLEEFTKVSMELGDNYTDELMEQMGKLQEEIDAVDGWTLENQVEMAMAALRCPEGNSPVTNLSGGEIRRVALAKLLLSKPDLLLLDEPTNHLDAETVAWLEHHLKNYQGAVIIVTHDRYFLDNITGWVLELDRGAGHPFEGNYSAWLENREKRISAESKDEASRLSTIKREIEWIRSSPSARRSKSKARISAFDELVNKADKENVTNASIFIPVSKRLGTKVINFSKVQKAFGDKLLIEDLSFSLPAGGIVGVIGANGAGKTTLFKMITDEEKPDNGEIEIGETVDLGYVSQSRENLENENSVWEEISGGNDLMLLGKREVNSRAYCGWYNFKGADQQKKVKDLSGGERNRVQMAKLLKKGSNVLLLDEPTNDLDVETLSELEAALENFAGCAVIITHDRWFLDRLATHILAFEGDSHVEWFDGDYQSYIADKIKRTGSNDEVPKRIQYKRLTR